jgi:hypothetical protein
MANVRREINKLINDLEETVGTKCNHCVACNRWLCQWRCPEHPKEIVMGEPLDKDSIFDPQTCAVCGTHGAFTFDIGDRDVDADI